VAAVVETLGVVISHFAGIVLKIRRTSAVTILTPKILSISYIDGGLIKVARERCTSCGAGEHLQVSKEVAEPSQRRGLPEYRSREEVIARPAGVST